MKELLYKDRLKQIGLWTLEERRNRADLLEMFKMLTGVRYPKPPNSINFTISFTYFIVTHRNAR